jgi:hypothetical protein
MTDDKSKVATPTPPTAASKEKPVTVAVPKEMTMGEPITEKITVPAKALETPLTVVNELATPQPSQILSDEKKAQMAKLKSEAPDTVAVKPDAPATSEVRREVAPGAEHTADDRAQVAYATVLVSDKTVPVPAVEPMGSKRLADEQAAGKAALVRKHGPDQLKREQAQGAKSASRNG